MTVSKVGIRELRQNLSVYVRRVKTTDDEFIVTERGVPVARLTRAEGSSENWLDRMRREGRVKEGGGGFPRPVLGHLGSEDKRAIMEALEEQKADRL